MTHRSSAQHIIGRLVMDVSAPDEAQAQSLRLHLSALLTDARFLNDLNALFDRLAPSGELIEIDLLDLDIEWNTPETMIQNLFQAISEAVPLRHAPDSMPHSGVDGERPRANSFENAWLFFLEYGLLPWYCTNEHRSMIQDAQYASRKMDALATDRLRRLLSDSPRALRRFFQWAPANSLADWMKNLFHLTENEQQILKNGLFQFGNKADYTQSVFLPEIFNRLEANRGALPEIIAEWSDNGNLNPIPAPDVAHTLDSGQRQISGVLPDNQPQGSGLPEKTGIYFQNAGLVILSAALPGFFADLNLTQDRQFKNEKARCKALYLLQYLATGNLDAQEFDLPLNKILCGMRPEELPLYRPKPAAKEKKQADALLKTLISEWSALKNTTPNGLRELFFKREGSLEPVEPKAWKLSIQRKTEDILLDRLPAEWGFSVIKLPWMSRLLFVNWR